MSEWVVKIRGAAPACFIADHQCLDCGHRWELNLPTRASHESHLDEEFNIFIGHACPECGCFNTRTTDGVGTAPVTIVRGNHDFAERQNERLYKRSTEHFRKEGRDEAIERQRIQFKKEGLVS